MSVMLFSCINRKDGDWDDNIKLSVKIAEFSAEADSIIITTKGTWWWINDIKINQTEFYYFEGVNLESNHYTIQQDDILVERRNATTLFIKAGANSTGVKRAITVGLEAGDYFDRVRITQAAN